MGKKDILRFQIAMNNSMLLQQKKTAQELLRKAADQFQGESTEAVRLDELIEIHVEKLCGYAKMTSEVETLCEVNHAMFVFGIL
jgi:hypothetical protein